jgi:hypothetical protein
MDFRKSIDSFFVVGTTAKGNTVSFVQVPQSKIVTLNEGEQVEAIREVGSSTFINVPQPTRLVIYCSFPITTKMVDELESSKIIRVMELDNNNQQIIAHPLFSFDFEKLQNILFNMSKKFDL